MNLTEYLKDISKFDLLTAEEEKKLFRRVKQGDEQAREQAITSNLRLVVNIAKKYSHSKASFSELVQEGNYGLIKAVDKFNPELDKRFSTYATFWIKQSVLKFLNDSKSSIRYPAYVIDNMNKVSRAIADLKKENIHFPNEEQIAKKAEIATKDVCVALSLIQTSYTSLDQQIENGKAVSKKCATVEEDLCEEYTNLTIIDMIIKLRPKEREIIINRYGLFGNEALTLEKVAQKMNLTRERVRQIQNSVINKLKERAKRV